MTPFDEATAAYERTLAAAMPLDPLDLREKHDRMADASPFPFFRATYYRWVEHWPQVCPEWSDAPKVLCVGDLHIENFGTWRDAYSRLAWGVNDFDEAAELPYAADLIRLAASVRAAKAALPADVKMGEVCRFLMEGYTRTLESGGEPFILEESHPELRAMAMAEDPKRFWEKFDAKLRPAVKEIPEEAQAILAAMLPPGAESVGYFHRRAGLGSLGRPRIAMVCTHRGAKLAWEAKRAVPPPTGGTIRSAECVAGAVRSHDPADQPGERWISRRLGPRYARIELDHLKRADLAVLFTAMGAETANVHLGTKGAASAILADLKARPIEGLQEASKRMSHALEADWQTWRSKPKV